MHFSKHTRSCINLTQHSFSFSSNLCYPSLHSKDIQLHQKGPDFPAEVHTEFFLESLQETFPSVDSPNLLYLKMKEPKFWWVKFAALIMLFLLLKCFPFKCWPLTFWNCVQHTTFLIHLISIRRGTLAFETYNSVNSDLWWHVHL